MAIRAVYVMLYCNAKDVEETFMKVGVTKSPTSRVSHLRCVAKKDDYRVTFLGGHIVDGDSYHKEDQLLNELESHKLPSHVSFNGHTECVTTGKSNVKYVSNMLDIPVDDIMYRIELLKKDAVNQKEEKAIVTALENDCAIREIEEEKQKTKTISVSGTGKYTIFCDDQEVISCDFHDIVVEDGVIYTLFKSSGMVSQEHNL